MLVKTLMLADYFPALAKQGKPTLTIYCPDTTPEVSVELRRPSILVLPGGAYWMTSDREAEPIALAYVGRGYNAFVLRYTCAEEGHYPTQLLEAAAAMALIRRNAAEWHAMPDKIAVIGFSAGGHLAGMISTFWKEPVIGEQLGVTAAEARPDASILSYAVLSGGKFGHIGSFKNLIGDDATPEQLDRFSIEKRVDSDTPPAFIWHTAADDCVPVENALLYAAALSARKIPFELHIFPYGHHGISLADREVSASAEGKIPYVARWMELSVEWLKLTFGM